SSEYSLILNIRLPRILLGVLVGASLSVAGTSFQALLRNPLADPYVLGVSNGAAVGAILALLLEPHLALTPEIASVFTPLGGFLGAAIAYIAASALTGLAVAMSGSIGYVGLLVPHVMRMIFGSDHRILIPASAFGGAIVLVIADTLARTVAAPAELPVGAITAIAGAPLFI